MNEATRAVVERLVEALKTCSVLPRQEWLPGGAFWRWAHFDESKVSTAIAEARKLLEQSEWVRVSDAFPDAGPVLAMVEQLHGGKRKAILRACYVEKNTLESNGDADYGEYDEATDNFYWPEGWYERNEFEETHWFIDGAVTHWQPLPQPPEPTK